MKKNRYGFETIQLEGGLFVPDILEKILLGGFASQNAKDYRCAKDSRSPGSLSDAVGYAFELSKAHYKNFKKQISEKSPAEDATFEFVKLFLRDGLGFDAPQLTEGISINDRIYNNINFCPIPLVIASCKMPLDRADEKFAIQGGGRRKITAFQLLQEFLNASNKDDWGLVTNGEQIRLLRRSSSLTRPCWLEFDLGRILNEDRYPDFAAMFRTLHSSRAGGIWEQWRESGREQGVRVREGLRMGVAESLRLLGSGFISNPKNEILRKNLHSGVLSVEGYFQQLLRLVYRFLFLFTLEERGLLHTEGASNDEKNIYLEGYAMRRLRERCLKNAEWDRHTDLWDCVKIVFASLANGEPSLGLPAVGGLFGAGQCSDIEGLMLENKFFLKVISHLRWSRIDDNYSPIDYRNMGVEELGSVYESLLEYVPQIDLERRTFDFLGYDEKIKTAGNARKTSGSYYTPDSLVQELLKSALLPVIEQNKRDILNIKVIDPACGSGHFLLGAARYLAEHLAREREPDGVVLPKNYRQALRDVISHCVYGVDINPLAVELCRMSLWLESFDPSRPLSFLDHHLVCGNSLLGLVDDAPLRLGIPDEAFSALSGDDKELCRTLKRGNSAERARIEKLQQGQRDLFSDWSGDNIAAISEIIEQMPDAALDDVRKKEMLHGELLKKLKEEPVYRMANLYMAAFLAPKVKTNSKSIPTSGDLYLQMTSDEAMYEKGTLRLAARVCEQNKVLHWWLTFPVVMAGGGFDCVIGNPPWERIKLQEQEFFAARHPEIANAKNKAARDAMIKKLSAGDAPERRIYDEFIAAKQSAEASSAFSHVNDGGRFPLTGTGDVNTYALFAELFTQLKSAGGRAGVIVPSGIATDDSTKKFFSSLVRKKDIVSLYDFENRLGIFAGVHRSYKFCLLTTGESEAAEFSFFLQSTDEINDEERKFTLSSKDFSLLNPNTLTCPVFRSKYDAELTKKIYHNAPILIREKTKTDPEQNPWGIKFMRMLDMSNDSHLFEDEPNENRLPLYEAKMIHHFDHRWATYSDGDTRDVTAQEKNDPNFEVVPRYWVDKSEVARKLQNVFGTPEKIPEWLMGWRKISNATNERTTIASVFPLNGAGDSINLMLFKNTDTKLVSALLGNICSITLDYVARQKLGGTNLAYYIYEQLPILPPEKYTESDLSFIVPRVLELTYTSHAMSGWAHDIGYNGQPFKFDPTRRAQLRAELDAYYAKLYGLTRPELEYILDPASVKGEGYPSVTFPGLKNNEMKQFGEFRTQRLVLEAWDGMGTD